MNIDSISPSALPTAPVNHSAQQVREKFTEFVGSTFYAQMLKSMRTTLGKPAYFHGGQAEEIFTSQLDQTLASTLADKSTDQLIDPMFRQQFPELAKKLDATTADPNRSLDMLRRR